MSGTAPGEPITVPDDFTPAARVLRIRESPSVAASARARDLKAQGRTIIDFTVGEPDFDTPRNVKDAATAAIEAGQTKYTAVNGTPALRAAIRSRMLRTSGIEYTDPQLTIGGGGKQVIYMAFAATLDPGDQVIIPTPYWVSYPDMVLANDGTPVIVSTRPDSAYKLTPTALEAAITDRTKWLVLNTPSNPIGVLYTPAELAALAEVLERYPHVWVLSDEIYDEILYTSQPFAGVAAAMPGIRSRVFTVNGVSKTYAMTGWRLGYGVGDPRLIAAINKLQSQVSSCPSSISQAAAAEALTGDQSFVTDCVAAYRSRRDLALRLIGAIDGLTPITPDGAFYLYIGCGDLIGRHTASGAQLRTDEDVTLFLLEAAGVAVIQGSAYGTAPFFRMSFATSESVIEAGAAAIAGAVATLR